MISSPSSLQASWLTPRKKAFLTGTLLLTGTGFLCRILGFFYRIFLSRTIGAEGLGIYNMVHPVFGICFFTLRRFPANRFKPVCGGQPKKRAERLLQSPGRFFVPLPSAGLSGLPL